MFFLPRKTSFPQAQLNLDKYLNTSFSIEPFCFALDRYSIVCWSVEIFFWPLCLLDRSSTHSWSIKIFRFLLDSTSTASRSVEMISSSFYLLDTFSTDVSIHRVHVFSIDSTSTARQILFCPDLVLDRFLTDPWSIKLRFSIYSWGVIWFSFLLSHLDRTSSISIQNPSFSLKSFNPPQV